MDLYEHSFFQKVLGKETFLDILHTATEGLEFMIRYRTIGLVRLTHWSWYSNIIVAWSNQYYKMSIYARGNDESFTFSQLIRPDLREKYTATALKFRSLGHHCIKQRIKALEANQTVPEDVLTKILSVARKFMCS